MAKRIVNKKTAKRLTKQDRKPTQEEVAARKEAVHSLYEQRVLGRHES